MKKVIKLVLDGLGAMVGAVFWLFADKCPDCSEVLVIDLNPAIPSFLEQTKKCPACG